MEKPKLTPDFSAWSLGDEFHQALEKFTDTITETIDAATAEFAGVAEKTMLDCLAVFLSDFLSEDAIALLKADGLEIYHEASGPSLTIPWGTVALSCRMETLVPLFRFIREQLDDDDEFSEHDRARLHAILG